MDQMKPTPEFEKALDDVRCAEAMLLEAKQRLAAEGHRMYLAVNPIPDKPQEPQKLVVTRPKQQGSRPGQRRWSDQEIAILKGIVEKHPPADEKTAYIEAGKVLGRTTRSAQSQVSWLRTRQLWDQIKGKSADNVEHVNG